MRGTKREKGRANERKMRKNLKLFEFWAQLIMSTLFPIYLCTVFLQLLSAFLLAFQLIWSNWIILYIAQKLPRLLNYGQHTVVYNDECDTHLEKPSMMGTNAWIYCGLVFWRHSKYCRFTGNNYALCWAGYNHLASNQMLKCFNVIHNLRCK